MPGYHAKKRLGQNFLKSETVIKRVVETVAPIAGERIIEIGPGRGALTLALAESGAQIVGVEFDRDLSGYLNKLTRRYDNVEIVNADFLEFQPDPDRMPSFKLVGNLPYNITSPVIDWCMRYHDRITGAVFMVQKELALRLAASPGSKNWSPLSVFTQTLFDVEFGFDVSPASFRPTPKVISSVVRLAPHGSDVSPHGPEFTSVVRASFRQRRKLLVNNLVPDIVPDGDLARQLLTAAGLEPGCRAEQVTTEQFLSLTACLLRHKLV